MTTGSCRLTNGRPRGAERPLDATDADGGFDCTACRIGLGKLLDAGRWIADPMKCLPRRGGGGALAAEMKTPLDSERCV